MNISSVSINRPVLAIVMSVIIVLFGGIGYSYLGVREYPSIDPPIITVRTNYSGANADVIESQITEPLEKALKAFVPSLLRVTRDQAQSLWSVILMLTSKLLQMMFATKYHRLCDSCRRILTHCQPSQNRMQTRMRSFQ